MVQDQYLNSIKRNNSVIWKTQIGCFHWRNSIEIADGFLIVSTSGQVWGERDPKDGIQAIDPINGGIKWHHLTEADANEILIYKDIILFGCDDGIVEAISQKTGESFAKIEVGSSVRARPIGILINNKEILVVHSDGGDVISFDPKLKQFKKLGNLPGRFGSNAVLYDQSQQSNKIIISSEKGKIFVVTILDDNIDFEKVYEIDPGSSVSKHYSFDYEVTSVGSLTNVDNNLLLAYSLNTSSKRPPLELVCKRKWKKIWRARLPKTLSKKRNEVGNIRVSPIVMDTQILTTFSYSDSLYAFSVETGKGYWRIQLDKAHFQNWSSLVSLNKSRIVVPRVNGMVFEVDLKTNKVVKNTSINIPDFDGIYSNLLLDDDETSDRFGKTYPGQELVSGLATTPLFHNNILYVGTVTGELIAVNWPVD